MTDKKKIYIIGAGPAGLSAAYELAGRKEFDVFVLEQAEIVGGISRTEHVEGFYFDIGGHRFYTKDKKIQNLWQEMLGDDFREVKRLSRIYYRGKYFHYPLKFWQTIFNLGVIESLSVCLSYLKAVVVPLKKEETFEEWTINRFGKKLYSIFFKSYTEKVWGVSCQEIQADWAAQRIQGLSFSRALGNALFGSVKSSKTLIEKFHYPVFGPGMMWERFKKKIESKEGQVCLRSRVKAIHHDGARVISIRCVMDNGVERVLKPDELVSSIPLKHLVSLLDPKPPKEVSEAAAQLEYRAFIIVVLMFKQEYLFPDQWIYIHEPDVAVGRIQNFKNWSAAMVPDTSMTSLGMEYFCSKNDFLWGMSDADLVALASSEIERLGIAGSQTIVGHHIVRQQKAYPVYDRKFKRNVEIIKQYTNTIENLQSIGRNGTHRYNNMDHSMLTGIVAARNISGESIDIWSLGSDEEYLEGNDCSGSL